MRTVLVALAAILLVSLFAVQAKAGDCRRVEQIVVQDVGGHDCPAQNVQVQKVVTYAPQAVVVQKVQRVVVQDQYVAPVVVKRQAVVRQAQFVGGYSGFRQAQFVGGGRQRVIGGGGGGNFVTDTIDAVGRLANSPAGGFALGVLAGRGF